MVFLVSSKPPNLELNECDRKNVMKGLRHIYHNKLIVNCVTKGYFLSMILTTIRSPSMNRRGSLMVPEKIQPNVGTKGCRNKIEILLLINPRNLIEKRT